MNDHKNLRRFKISFDGGESSDLPPSISGPTKVITYDESAAYRTLFIVWGSTWALALLTLPIPIVHLFAPWVLFLLGPLLGFVAFKLQQGKSDVQLEAPPCPKCGKEIYLPRALESWPVSDTCFGCNLGYTAKLEE